ncbi:MAG TPA: GGDEF domain-containing protein [Firmicutes bacterium]|nr:GGDEF domain-containing protein [Bacillota bacterium]
MQVAVGYCDNPDSALAGRLATQKALDASGRTDVCDLVLLFCTARHNQQILRQEVARVTGNYRRIYGGGAAGIITNNRFGYAGDQVGVACIWLEGSSCHVIDEGGLSLSEFNTGGKLGVKFAKLGISPDSTMMLFYDAVKREPGNIRLAMSTWLLEGMERQLGFLPDILGAGLQGDHILTPTQQFLGSKMDSSCVFALAFSKDIQIDYVILHGCRPASPYYTVTKADGPTILEIDGKPAISFMDKLLKSSIKPEKYPFFLIFGVNHGDIGGDFKEENYANRLCQGLDEERGGIVMFEPDMVPGTKFQIMFRSLELDYIRPKIEGLLDSLEGRKPVFALYIDCAGRCAGYGGSDLEDASVIQDIVQDRFPLLGLYTGVEIAPLGGKSRSLDWTGVFCVFSEGSDTTGRPATTRPKKIWEKKMTPLHKKKELSFKQMEGLCVQNIAKILALDSQSISMRSELEQKRRGFSLLAELSVFLKDFESPENVIPRAIRRINAALNMQRTILLLPNTKELFTPFLLHGFTEEKRNELAGKQLAIDPDLLGIKEAVLVTADSAKGYLADFRKKLELPYFISTPIVVKNEISGILITGRMAEMPPFLPCLSDNEAETLQAVAALLASFMVYQKLDEAKKEASIDVLSGLYNRGALEREIAQLLKQESSEDVMFTFIIIDLDNFKEINDKFGHIAGDQVLKSFAKALHSTFRATDIISRFGGDEFVVFCAAPNGLESIRSRAEKLVESWARTPQYTVDGELFYSSLSVGISIARGKGATYQGLLQMADIALYDMKRKGRNGCSVYDERTMKKVSEQ